MKNILVKKIIIYEKSVFRNPKFDFFPNDEKYRLWASKKVTLGGVGRCPQIITNKTRDDPFYLRKLCKDYTEGGASKTPSQQSRKGIFRSMTVDMWLKKIRKNSGYQQTHQMT